MPTFRNTSQDPLLLPSRLLEPSSNEEREHEAAQHCETRADLAAAQASTATTTRQESNDLLTNPAQRLRPTREGNRKSRINTRLINYKLTFT